MEKRSEGEIQMKFKWPVKISREDVERSLILCASAMVVALALGQNAAEKETNAKTQVNLPVVNVQQTENTRQTVVYLQDGEGYLVPVTCQVADEEGIAKATLNKMVASSENDLFAARLGLKTTIPEGTTIDLDIANGKARVDLGAQALNCMNAEEEDLMVQSIVHTLCQYDTVEEVDFLFDGQKRSKLTYGYDVSSAFAGGSINFESTDAVPTAGAQTVKLYFPSSSGRMLVPVTRTVYSDADVTTAILELIKGPKKDSGLHAPLPENCGLKNVSLKDGVVTIDFTGEFAAVMESESGSQTLDALIFTAKQFPGVQEVKLQIEGKDYTPPAESKATSINLSSEIISYYPGVIETD